MSLSLWVLLSLLSRIALYASVASAVGGLFASLLLAQHRDCANAIRRYIVWGCVAGVMASMAGFTSQVGALSDQGVMGMVDTVLMAILWQSSVGTALALQLGGFIVIGGTAGWLLKTQKPPTAVLNLITVMGCLSLLAAFSQVGHFAEQPLLGKAALSLHVLAMSLWMGSLYPLWIVSRTTHLAEIQRSMERFGQVAVVMVGVLVACGILMAAILLKDFHRLSSTPYGQGLVAKLALVGGLLLLAARNKWLNVPRFLRRGYSASLSHTILFEILLGTFVFLITGIITVVIGIDAAV